MMVKCKIVTDDRQVSKSFDAEQWFQQADNGDIRELVAWDWGGEIAESIVYHLEEKNGGNVERGIRVVYEYLNKYKPRTPDNLPIGFTVKVDQRTAMLWLREHRTDLWNEIRREISEEAV